MTRRLVLLLVLAVAAIAACDRVVDLTPAPDAHGPDAASGDPDGGFGNDGGAGNDGGFDGGGLPDAGAAPDA
jgi:hypothetical protein